MSEPTDHAALASLHCFIARCFAACGMPGRDADIAAELISRADLMGQDKREAILGAIVALAGEIGVDVTAEQLLDEVGS